MKLEAAMSRLESELKEYYGESISSESARADLQRILTELGFAQQILKEDKQSILTEEMNDGS